MHVKEGLVFDKHSGDLVGFRDLGEINNHISRLERTRSTSQVIEPLAKSLLVLMVRGLFSDLQFPYAQFPCASLSGEQIYHIFWEAVERLERQAILAISNYRNHITLSCRNDVKVLCVTCDGYSANRRFLKIHECDRDDTMCTHKLRNPFASDVERKYIYFISDPPHLIKTVRNAWASRKRNLWVCINN